MASRKSKSEVEREKVIQSRLQELLTRMLQDEDNKYCVDCDAKGPRWASWNIGIFVCIRCAGIHRNLGVHISKVKSVNLDSWTPHQVACMQIMGNSKARAVYEANVPEGFRRPQTDAQLDVFIRAKYEKKKYIAREWVPIKAPELPEGWTALIEAEKQKKDIRSIVLPSHTNTNDDIVKRERQSPKEAVTKKTNSTASANSNSAVQSTEKKTPQISAVETVKATPAKPLESDFDLLSLSQQSTQQTVTTKSAIANDLLCLGGGDNSSEFDEFVGAQKSNSSPQIETKTNGNQNGTSHQHFFDDFNIVNTSGNGGSQVQDQENAQKQTMSKDSIMALFNQKPVATGLPQINPISQQQFPNQGFMTNNTSMPGAGGMQIPANFGGGLGGNGSIGTGNVGLLTGLGQGQQFQQSVGGPGMMNNPFLAMAQPVTRSDQNNVFGGFSSATPGTNQNFLQ